MSPVSLQVYPILQEKSMYYIKLRTSHYSFSLKNSCVVRSLDSFYQLRKMIVVSLPYYHALIPTIIYDSLSPQTHHTYLTVPPLPLQPVMWVSSYKTVSTALARFIAEVSGRVGA